MRTLIGPLWQAGFLAPCSRLHTLLQRRYLAWLLKALRAQLDELEGRMADAADEAAALALRHRLAPGLQAHREGMRAQHRLLAERWLTVRRELDTLEAAS